MKEKIREIIKNAVLSLQKEGVVGSFEEIIVDYTANDKFGDYATNIAMKVARPAGKSPMEIAEEIRKKIVSDDFEKIEVLAPGYINFHLSKKYLQSVALKINSEKENFGQSAVGQGLRVNNEFISANPTGPLHLGNGRGGFYGDTLTNILRKAGFEVTNEYYVNDSGEQVLKLGHSVLKDSEAVYVGEYIDELNEKYKNISDVKEIGEKSAKDILKNIVQKTTKEKMRIDFDIWFSEKSLYEDGCVDKAIEILGEKKLTYKKEGALWLKTTDFGDDKDRVLIKSNGQKTYFASDCGYIWNKIMREFSKVIEIWGADHHGYIHRFRAAAEALGFKGELKFIIVQLVRLVKDGKEVRMSKRAGNVVYIDELIEKVGHDTARFFFLMYSPDTHMNFDLKLAEERSEKNPVFYVQYAHARICSLFRKAAELKMGNLESTGDLSSLNQEKELSLIKELNKFPELIEEIAQDYTAHKLPQYAIRLADKFHSFYNDCKILDEDNLEISRARLSLSNAVKIVLAETLRLIGVEAPEKM